MAISIDLLGAPADEAYVARFERELLPELRNCAQRVAYLVTESRPNAFAQLPVRENEWAFVTTGICPDQAAANAWSAVAPGETLILNPASRALYA